MKQLATYKKQYQPHLTKGTKNLSLDNGDDVATRLRSYTPDEVVAIAESLLKMPKGTLAQQYGKLNPGQRRMNAGNRIRNAIKRGDIKATAIKLTKTKEKKTNEQS